MKTDKRFDIRGEGALPIVIILLALVAGIVWFLYSSRRDADRDARKFANELANKVAVEFNDQYLHVHLSPELQPRSRPNESRQSCDQVSRLSRIARSCSRFRKLRFVIIASRFCTFGSASRKT